MPDGAAPDAMKTVLDVVEKALSITRELETKLAAVNKMYRSAGVEPINGAAAWTATLEEIQMHLSNIKKNDQLWRPRVTNFTETQPHKPA
jgi:hypothetical protein